MNELKPEDVMRALECCNTKGNCNQCPYEIVGEYTPCYSALTQDALALLREKDALLAEWDAKCNDYETQLIGKDAEIERLKNSITFQVVMPDEKMEEIKKECLKRVELDIKEIKAEAIADVVAQFEAEVDSSDKYIAEYDGSKVQIAYNQGLKNALKIVKEMEDGENGESDL